MWLALAPGSWGTTSQSLESPLSNERPFVICCRSWEFILVRWLRVGTGQPRKTNAVIRGWGFEPCDISLTQGRKKGCGQWAKQSWLRNGTGHWILAERPWWKCSVYGHTYTECRRGVTGPDSRGREHAILPEAPPLLYVSSFGWFWFILLLYKTTYNYGSFPSFVRCSSELSDLRV